MTRDELIHYIIDRAFRLLDVGRVVETGDRESRSRLGRFDLTCDRETAAGGVDGPNVAIVVWQRCSQPFWAIVDPNTRHINTVHIDEDKVRDEVIPEFQKAMVLDELASS